MININCGNQLKFYEKKIRIAELGKIILRGISSEGTEQEKIEYVELIKKGLEKCKISPSLIKLGKNRAGTRTITLEDIMPKEKIK